MAIDVRPENVPVRYECDLTVVRARSDWAPECAIHDLEPTEALAAADPGDYPDDAITTCGFGPIAAPDTFEPVCSPRISGCPTMRRLALRRSARPRDVLVGAQGFDLAFEIGCGLEGAVYRGEPQIGDLVELTQRAEDRQTHLVAGDLG